jgi:hypothetical protein
MKQPLLILCGALLFFHFTTQAQVPGGAQGMNPVLHRLIGKHSFTAKSDIQIQDADRKETLRMTMAVSVLDRKMRADVDMNEMKSDQVAPELLAQMKQLGMDRVASITRPDKQLMYLIYPGLKSYVELPLSKEEAAAFSDTTPLKVTALGKETVQGQACVKNRVTFTNELGQAQHVLVWNASRLKDFPVQVEVQEEGNTVKIQFRDVQLSKPDARQFDPSPGFARFTNVQQMMMQRLMEPAVQ